MIGWRIGHCRCWDGARLCSRRSSPERDAAFWAVSCTLPAAGRLLPIIAIASFVSTVGGCRRAPGPWGLWGVNLGASAAGWPQACRRSDPGRVQTRRPARLQIAPSQSALAAPRSHDTSRMSWSYRQNQ
jgi:hypothetical protein